MAGKGIKGITFDIGGDTRGLDKALQNVEKEAVKTQKELKEVEKASKIDPSSTELYAQKQQLLQKQVSNTADKLDVLKKAQSQVEEQFKNGKIGEEQYRAFQRELVMTEQGLKSYQGQIDKTRAEHHALAESTKNMKTFFEATGTSVNTFSDVLGTKLTNAIKEGKASSQQLEQALEKMGKTALGSSADFEKMKHALANVDQKGLKQVQKELAQVSKEAKEAGDEVNGFGNKLSAVAGGLVAGGGLAAIIGEALDVSSLNTDIELSMGIKGGDVEVVRSSINSVVAAIGDEEAAYEGVRRQFTLNKNASVETNQEIIKGASMISRAYKEVDFKELIQESHEIGKELGITQQEALGLTNQLLSVGFPSEQLDIISEYGSQLKMAGFSAEEVQAIMAAGVETGTWNIDILMDGLKEGRIVAAEFGQGVDKAMKESLEGTNISAEALEKWGQAVAKGGDDGAKALVEMNAALMGIEDETKRNEIGVKLYGTLWEEQGKKISDSLQNMGKHMKTTGEMTGKLKDDTSTLEADPAYRLAEAMNDVKESMAPVLADIAEVVASIADWVAENPKLAGTLVAVVVAVGTLLGAFAAFMPAIGSLVGMLGGASATAGILGTTFTVLTGPIGLTIAAIAAVGIGLFALNKHMQQSSFEVEDWSNNVSEGTAKAVGAYMDLDKKATDAFLQLKWSGETITGEMATSLIETNNQMTEAILTNMREKHKTQLEEQTTYFEESKALSATREAEILEATKQKQIEEQTAITEGQAKINQIYQTASNEKRGINQQEAAEIEKIQLGMKEKAVQYLSESERDQKVILETLKRDSSQITAQQAADVVKNSNKQKDETIKDAEETYKKRVAAITKMRDEDKSISAQEADALIKEAERSKTNTIKNANEMHQKVVSEAKGQAKEHVNEVNWETGEVKTKWEKFKGDIGKVWSDMGTNFKKSLSDMWTGAKKLWGDIEGVFSKSLDKITGFFKGLKFEFPKPKMPPMPHFKMSGSFSLNPPSVPKIGIDWYAKGGLMTKPTAFGMNGNNLMVGGEVPNVSEAILPLTPKVLAGIGKGIAEQMGGGQQVMYVQPAPVYMDGEKVGEITFDTINQRQYKQTNILASTKGVNL
ncbi:hypothetical protein B1B04_13080 [Lysinibacillus sp. KCTC 33748]|uniref:hypothetical protein n=1 Tax=unclassified Lysinibacillus TaxID=2636778 RepID=UPI0009A6B2FF|nr:MULTISPECIES: hypothetical protein [unclassified Lysinibacillus]OXS73215.1 hypothetical protein B1B04_13080 [Lysinibacillus sp. KCTC 33748]SKB82723.1 Phage-related minor tail protein [Lysinibacillus sp. AC-3]